MIKKNLSLIFIFLLFVTGILLHIYQINSYPPSLNWDEVSLGYNTYSILKTAKDEWGSFLPSIFRAYGDYKLPLYIYSSLPFISILGLTSLSVKLVSIIAGAVSPIILFLICRHLFPKHPLVAPVASIIMVFSPWSILLSRIALEANLYLLFFLLFFYFLITKKYNFSLLFLSLSLFTYNSSRVLLIIFLPILIYSLIKNKVKFQKILPGVSFISLSLILLAFQSLDSSASARYKWTTLIDQGTINRINEARGNTALPHLINLSINNKVTYFFSSAAANYISNLNPLYIFRDGGSNYQFNIPNFYLIYPLFFIFLILGLVFIINHRLYKNPDFIIFAILLFSAPIPSAITRDAPHTLRSISFFPLLTIVIALGYIFSLEKLLKFKFFLLLPLVFILVYSQSQFWPAYASYSQKYSSSWQSGYSEMVSYLKTNYSQYDKFYITKKYGEPHEFILFYWPWNPQKYQSDGTKNWNFHADWYWVDGFDKFIFFNDWEVQKTVNLKSNELLITSPRNYPDHLKLVTHIKDKYGNIIFDVLTN